MFQFCLINYNLPNYRKAYFPFGGKVFLYLENTDLNQFFHLKKKLFVNQFSPESKEYSGQAVKNLCFPVIIVP